MNRPDGRGVFITLEGGEGAGKTTQIKILEARLRAAGQRVVVTREPGGSAAAERIRAVILDAALELDAMTQLLLFNAARRDHWLKTIKPALQSGCVVLCDRFFDSTYAYQGAAGGLAIGAMRQLTSMAIGDAEPDLTLILDVAPGIGLARAGTRRGDGKADSFESKPAAFHSALRQGFLDIAAQEPDRCKVIDASGGSDEVADRIGAIIGQVFPELRVKA
jgi:dTMP kinase